MLDHMADKLPPEHNLFSL